MYVAGMAFFLLLCIDSIMKCGFYMDGARLAVSTCSKYSRNVLLQVLYSTLLLNYFFTRRHKSNHGKFSLSKKLNCLKICLIYNLTVHYVLIVLI